jgi:hypothetical protein
MIKKSEGSDDQLQLVQSRKLCRKEFDIGILVGGMDENIVLLETRDSICISRMEYIGILQNKTKNELLQQHFRTKH